MESLRTNVQEHRPQLRLAVRVTTAAVLAFAASQLLHVPLPLWTVLTAVILTQVTFGRSVKATADYLVGTVGGAIYAGAVSVMIPHADGVSLAAVLAIAVAPLAFLGAIFPSFSAAPFTGVLVLLLPGFVHTGPFESAIYRVLEVTVGGVTALAVSLVVFPARAHSAAIEAAARAAELMAKSLPQLFQGFLRPLDSESITRIQDAIGEGVSRTQSIAEARHERIVLLAADPDLRPLLRTLSRLRHDFVMLGRAAVEPLPDALEARLGPPVLPKQNLFQRWPMRLGQMRQCRNIFRLALADMLEGGSVLLSDPSWRIRAVRRQDEKQTRGRIAAWAEYKEVQELINHGKLMTVACREVANRRGKTQRAIEIAYKERAALMYNFVEEPGSGRKLRYSARRRAEKVLPTRMTQVPEREVSFG
jgi:uncharacterized membrane protein YccC